jgi:hypothetical protein
LTENNFLSAHQPAFMPWLGYLHRIAISESFVILDNVQFEKNSFINRNIIQNRNKKDLQWLTVPVSSKNHFSKTIKQIELDLQSNWKKKHLAKIKQEYGNELFFEERYVEIKKIYDHNHRYFTDFVHDILQCLLDLFLIETNLLYQSNLNIDGKGTQLIANLCKKLKFQKFLFGVEAKTYFNKGLFYEYGFVGYEHKYQCHYSFDKFSQKDKNVSSLDLIFKYDKPALNDFLLIQNSHIIKKI